MASLVSLLMERKMLWVLNFANRREFPSAFGAVIVQPDLEIA